MEPHSSNPLDQHSKGLRTVSRELRLRHRGAQAPPHGVPLVSLRRRAEDALQAACLLRKQQPKPKTFHLSMLVSKTSKYMQLGF